jgi:triosephosphate isomerase
MSNRRPLLAGNWKMNLNRDEARALATGLRETLGDLGDRDVAFYPPLTALPTVLEALEGSAIRVGGQAGHHESSGAFTGAVSMGQLKDAGASLVLCGHSERRHVFGETDEQIGLQVEAALAAGLEPTLCVGETIEEREAGQTWAVVERQLRTGLAKVAETLAVTIAYEPVWAIGTGLTATPEQAQEIHGQIRAWLRERGAENLRVLYGGSVKPSNVAELMAAEDIDGALVGGASLKVDSFAGIVNF